ncbi:MAG: hypothetical protein IT175_18955 [Acidobacteria bacterium]|nr:hypothetical protein [Acidobacteriota bacterium]
MNIVRVDPTLSTSGNRYLLCSILSQRVKRIHRAQYPGDCRIGPALAEARASILSGQMTIDTDPAEETSPAAE